MGCRLLVRRMFDCGLRTEATATIPGMSMHRATSTTIMPRGRPTAPQVECLISLQSLSVARLTENKYPKSRKTLPDGKTILIRCNQLKKLVLL